MALAWKSYVHVKVALVPLNGDVSTAVATSPLAPADRSSLAPLPQYPGADGSGPMLARSIAPAGEQAGLRVT